MEQIAHQALLMQLIMEMAKTVIWIPEGVFIYFSRTPKKVILKCSKMHLKLSSQESDFIPKHQVFTCEVQNRVPHFGGGSVGYSILSIQLSSV